MTTVTPSEAKAEDTAMYATAPASMVANVLKTIPTTTAHQARIQLYQPTRRPVWKARVIQTAWGTATIRGKIGQVHADIVEAICRFAEDHRIVPVTGHMQLLVDPYKVRVSVGAGKPYSQDTLWRMLTELREVSITIEIPSQKIKVLGGVLDRVEESPATRINPVTQKPRQLWRVTFDPAFAALLQQDLHLHYNPAPLAHIDAGIAQAIARHVLTHRDHPAGGWSLDGLIKVVGAGESSTSMRHRRREVHACAEQLKSVGIVIEGDRIYKLH